MSTHDTHRATRADVTPLGTHCACKTHREGFLLKTEKPQNMTSFTQLGDGTSNEVLSPISALFLVPSCNTEFFSGLLSLFADLCLEIQLRSGTVSLPLSWLSEKQKIACGENPSAGPHTSLHQILITPTIIKGTCLSLVTTHSKPKS